MEILVKYRLSGAQKLNLAVTDHLSEPDSASKILVRGILDGEAKSQISAAIDFEKGCKGSSGEIDLDVTILSDAARAVQKPEIYCRENAVSARHKAVSGHFDGKTLMYLSSRGFSPKRAREALIEAKFKEATPHE